jgi:hypothetical protein
MANEHDQPTVDDVMASEHDQPTLDDVLETTETVTPHHRDHAKTPKHLDDDELERRTEEEREEVGLDDDAGS